ncbi:MAG: hypothetical protein EZS28_018200 [Streblomastix strix]|uniref:Uncharacterized protein n=1 Tax=Streblomastix strix TaxID=222440 RepID=A0A5J4VUS5_9EUKA|nr:MAG: hypothetical protein EZS28_018200 [Streblomastix strix]
MASFLANNQRPAWIAHLFVAFKTLLLTIRTNLLLASVALYETALACLLLALCTVYPRVQTVSTAALRTRRALNTALCTQKFFAPWTMQYACLTLNSVAHLTRDLAFPASILVAFQAGNQFFTPRFTRWTHKLLRF